MTDTFKFTIKNHKTGTVIFEALLDVQCKKEAYGVQLGAAVMIAKLCGADLRDANLRGAYLCGADLRGAYLCGADLRHAKLCGADLRGADLRGADLHGADLRHADLNGADLRDADLRDAKLLARLRGADLRGAAGISVRVIDGGARSDGIRFLLTRTDPGEWRVIAGGRDFTLTEARKHWTETRGDTDLGHETFLILDHMVALAKLRKWPEQGEELKDTGEST